MITFITGLPGASKTLNTIKRVVEEWGDSGRPIHYVGIDELQLDWTELTPNELQKWWELPENSIIVVDEAQRHWPGRSNNKPVPESVSRMDTHRHSGFDFYIITQRYTLVDHGVRAFSGRFFHYERGFNREGARELEFQKVLDPDDYHNRQDAQVTRVKFDKKYYSLYKSAEVHTHKPRIPKKLWAFVAAVVFTFAAGSYAFTNIMARTDDAPTVSGSAGAFDESQYQSIPVGSRGDSDRPLTVGEYIENWEPRVKDLPFSAPMYDEITEVKTYPRPQCMMTESQDYCECFTQQATPLEVEHSTCVNIVQNGWFNPYRDESKQVEGGSQRGRGLPARAAHNESEVQVSSRQADSKPKIIYLPYTHKMQRYAGSVTRD